MTLHGAVRFFAKELRPGFERLRLAGEPLAREPAAGRSRAPRTASRALRARSASSTPRACPRRRTRCKDGVFSDDDYLEQVALVQQDSRAHARARARPLRARATRPSSTSRTSTSSATCCGATRDPKYPGLGHPARDPAVAPAPRPRHRALLPGRRRGARPRARAPAGRARVLIVMSDHGFQPYTREVPPERLAARPRLPGAEGRQAHRPASGSGDVDWSRTRAYGIGFNGLYLNLAGREARGHRARPSEADALLAEIARAARGRARSQERARPWCCASTRPRRRSTASASAEGPDLVVGYNSGYGALRPVDARRDHRGGASRTTPRAGRATT